jgi:hypothetical protein
LDAVYVLKEIKNNTNISGGAVLEDGDGIELVQRYDPRNDTWTNMTPMKIPRSGAAICSLDSYIYVCGK